MKKLFTFHRKSNNEEMCPMPVHEHDHDPEPHIPHAQRKDHGLDACFPHDPRDHHGPHTPAHLRKTLPLDEQEVEELGTAINCSFHDEESVESAFRVFQEVAPPEIQVLIVQISKLYTKLASNFAKEHEEEYLVNVENYSFGNTEPSPRFTILDPLAKVLFSESYGEKAPAFIEALQGKPNEIIEAAILLARLYKLVSVNEEG